MASENIKPGKQPTSNQSATGNHARKEESRAISREQRSEAAKRGWVTRKKRKP